MTWYWDDLGDGMTLRGGSRTITDAEIALLPAIMGVTSPLFHDAVTAASTAMGRRILYGPALLGIAIGLTESCFHGSAMGLLGLTDVRFQQAVGSGDTVTASVTVESRDRREGRPGGRVRVADEIINDHGDTVLTFRRTLLLRLREEKVSP